MQGAMAAQQSNKRTHEQSIKEEYKGDMFHQAQQMQLQQSSLLLQQQQQQQQQHQQQQHLFQNGVAVGQNEMYENDNPNHIIDKNSNIWWCIDCDKKYKSYPAFYTHNKIKHNGNAPQKYKIPRALDAISKDRGRPRADNNPKMKFSQEDKAQHNLEDNLFDFLGNLGSKDSSNTIIREYLKKPSNAFEVLDKNKHLLSQSQSVIGLYQIIEYEFKRLNTVLKDHENDEFVDPLDIDPDTQDDVSLYNIKGLFNYMREKKFLNRISILVIFLAWLGKELTENALREVLIICIEYFTEFSQALDIKGPSSLSEARDDALPRVKMLYEKTHNSPFSFSLLNKYDDAKKLIEFFHQWFCNYEKMISMFLTTTTTSANQPPQHAFINPTAQIQIPQQTNPIRIPHPMNYPPIQLMPQMQGNMNNQIRYM